MKTTPANCVSLEKFIDLINKSTEYDANKLAGAYAYESSKESGYEINQESIVWYLDFLEEEGTIFDYPHAMEYALKLKDDIKHASK